MIKKRQDVPPFCKCNCGNSVVWNIRKNCWNIYICGHNVRDLKTRRKISKTLTGRKHTDETKRKISKSQKGKKLSKEHKKKISDAHKGMGEPYAGERNHKWRGGVSYKSYPLEYLKSREKIRERDNHTCQLCGKTKQPNGYKLDVHHIDYNKRNSNPKNLITLCSSCNKEVDINDEKEAWTWVFQRRIKNIYKKLG